MALLIGGVVVGCVAVLYPFLSALLWAGILVFTTWPVHEWIRARLHLGRSGAALVMIATDRGRAGPADRARGAGRQR